MANNNNNNISQDPRSEQIFSALEADRGLPQGALRAVMKVESGGKANALSSAGAKGAFQFMPATAQQYNVDVSNPWDSARGAADYLGDLVKQYKGNFAAALAHYNGGAHNAQYQVDGTVPSAAKVSPKNHAVNKNYVRDVLSQIPSPISSANASEQAPAGAEVFNPAQVTQPTQAAATHQQPANQPSAAIDPTKPMSDKERHMFGLKIANARARGFSDKEIADFYSKSNNQQYSYRFNNGLERGFTPEELVKHYGGKSLAQYEQDKADADPTKNMTGLERGLAGAGKLYVDTAHAAQQLWTRATGSDEDLKKQQAEEAQRQQRDQALMNTTAGKVGYIGAALLPTVASMGVGAAGATANAAANGGRAVQVANALLNPSTLKAAVASGAVQGALTPTTGDGQIGQNIAMGAVGGAAGAGIGKALGVVARPMGEKVAGKAPILTDMAERYNLPLSAANIARASQSDNIIAKQAAKAVSASNDTNLAVQHAIAKELGEGVGVKDAISVTDGLLKKNPYELFNAVSQTETIPVSRASLAKELAPALEKYAKQSGKKSSPALSEVMTSIEKFAPDARGVNPNVPPDLLQKTAQSLGESIRGNPGVFERELLTTAKNVFENTLDKAFEKNPTTAGSFLHRTAKDQFAKQQVINELIGKNSSGAYNVTPIQLKQAIQNAALDGKYNSNSHYFGLADTLQRLYGKNGMPINRTSNLSNIGLGAVGAAADLLSGGTGGLGATALVGARYVGKQAVNSTNPALRRALTGNTKTQRIVGKGADVATPLLANGLAAYASKNNK